MTLMQVRHVTGRSLVCLPLNIEAWPDPFLCLLRILAFGSTDGLAATGSGVTLQEGLLQPESKAD